MKNNKPFLGRGWSFPPSFDNFEGRGVNMVENEEDVRQSLEILLSTNLSERIMLPDYGCDLATYLFKSISNSEIHFLKELIRTAILNYEPRILLNDVFIDYSDYQDGIIRINIDYTIETSNTRFNLVFPYYMIEGTDIPRLYHQQITQSLEQD